MTRIVKAAVSRGRHADRRLARARRRRAHAARIFAIPMWEHLLLIVVALGVVVWSRHMQNSPFELPAQTIGAAIGIFAILRPVIIARWWLNKSALIITMNREIENAQHEVDHMAKESPPATATAAN